MPKTQDDTSLKTRDASPDTLGRALAASACLAFALSAPSQRLRADDSRVSEPKNVSQGVEHAVPRRRRSKLPREHAVRAASGSRRHRLTRSTVPNRATPTRTRSCCRPKRAWRRHRRNSGRSNRSSRWARARPPGGRPATAGSVRGVRRLASLHKQRAAP